MAKLTQSYVHGVSSTPLIGETIGVHFDDAAERWSGRDALIVRQQDVCWSYGELKAKVDAFAAGLLALGLSLTEFFVVDRRMSPVAALHASWDASVGKKGRLMLYLAGGGLLILAGYLAAGIGAMVAVSVVWIGLAVIYLNTPGTAPPQLDRSLTQA